MRASTVRIGVSSPLRLGEEPKAEDEVSRHIQALVRAGAEAICLPVGPESVESVYAGDVGGLLLSGGADITPEFYGGQPEKCQTNRDPERDRTEVALLFAAISLKLPILCICRGMQLANAVLGGTLIEDIPTELGEEYTVKHHQIRELNLAREEYAHTVQVIPGTKFSRIVGTSRFEVNSVHHQAIRDLAPGLLASAHSDDGLIEAVELAQPHPFFIGVQCHPESLRSDDSVSAKLFGAFVAAVSAKNGK